MSRLRRSGAVFLAVGLVAWFSTLSGAPVYKSITQDGRVVYSDVPPGDAREIEIFKMWGVMETPAGRGAARPTSPAGAGGAARNKAPNRKQGPAISKIGDGGADDRSSSSSSSTFDSGGLSSGGGGGGAAASGGLGLGGNAPSPSGSTASATRNAAAAPFRPASPPPTPANTTNPPPIVVSPPPPLSKCAEPAERDWMTAAAPLTQLISPQPCAVLYSNPPNFSWPSASGEVTYTLRVERESGSAKDYKSSSNHLSPDAPLQPGDYAWTVTYDGPDGSAASQPRFFRIAADAHAFVIPPAEAMLSRASKAPRPRSFPPGAEGAAMLAAFAGSRADIVRELVAAVEALSLQPPFQEPAVGTDVDQVWSVAVAAASRLDQALLAAFATKRDDLWAGAKQQALSLARWDPAGSTGFAVDDRSTRVIAVSLTRAYDWGYQRFSASERKVLETAITRRMKDLYEGVVRDGWNAIWNYPFDSHGFIALEQLAFMSAVMAGKSPTIDSWFKVVVPLYFQTLSPWGGEDGGYANGTNYSYWDMGGTFQTWDALRWTTGVDVRMKSFVNAFGLYWVYFTPPGTPANLFGDGAEKDYNGIFARYGKEYVSRISSPLLRWYAGQLKVERRSVADYLLSPPVEFADEPFPATAGNDLLLESIGWAAMHSSLRDPRRVSLYFKSSPFGSFSHSHADQNSFVIDVGGKRLAIDSGYYDNYFSAHSNQWYKQTRAHNAITFDGGIGQPLGEHRSGNITARGQIIAYASQPDYAYATGDATPAYGGELTRAIRSTVFLKPQVILVFDDVQSSVARTWEWNIHASNRIEVLSPTEVKLAEGGASLCVQLFSSKPVAFSQTNQFTVAPDGDYPSQAHGTFASRQKVARASFAAVIRANCVQADVSVTPTGSGWRVETQGKTVTFDGVNVDVQR